MAQRRKIGTAAPEVFSLHTDHLGSVVAVGDSAGGRVLNSYAMYEPFGGFLVQPTGTNPSVTDRGFTGQRHNNLAPAYLGLVYMNARYYQPQLGRFISPDALVPDPTNPQSHNRYSYAINNPLRYNDPSGHWFDTLIDIISIGMTLDDIRQNGLNWGNGISLVADGASLLLPGIAGGGMIVRALTHVDEAVQIADNAGDLTRVALNAGNVAQAADDVPAGFKVLSEDWRNLVPEEAQEVIAGAFKGEPRVLEATQDVIMNRYHNPGQPRSAWYSPTRYETPFEAQQKLALPVKNTASEISQQTLPPGNKVLYGEVQNKVGDIFFHPHSTGGGILCAKFQVIATITPASSGSEK